MNILYNEKIIQNNNFIKVTKVQYKPKIQLNVNPNELYTLLLHDPDAVGGTRIHWAVVNITNNNIKTSDIVLPYISPTPPENSGKHHYIFTLYKQGVKITDKQINNLQIECKKHRAISKRINKKVKSHATPFNINIFKHKLGVELINVKRSKIHFISENINDTKKNIKNNNKTRKYQK